MKTTKTMTAGQLKLGRGMEKRLGVSPSGFRDGMTWEQARDRNRLLLALSDWNQHEHWDTVLDLDWYKPLRHIPPVYHSLDMFI